MHAKEIAFKLVTNACAKQNYQLLDESIGVAHTRLMRDGKFFLLMRTFEFYYADEHEQRLRGTISQRGKEWLAVDFYVAPAPILQVGLSSDRKIIPFPRQEKKGQDKP